MSIQQQWKELEDWAARLEDLRFRQCAGLDVDPAEIDACLQAIRALAEALAPHYRHDPAAWGLLSGHLLGARLIPLELEAAQLAERYLTFEDILLDGKPVTPYSALQYLSRQENPQQRHEFLSRIARGHPALDQAWERHRAVQNEWAAQWDCTPLDTFLLIEGFDQGQLRRLLTEMGSAMGEGAARHPVLQHRLAETRSSASGREPIEPWEDFLLLPLVRRQADVPPMPAIDGVAAVRAVARGMGFDVQAIAMDLEDRPRKEPGASAWCPRFPGNVRICVKPTGSLDDLVALYHEMGHALHCTSRDAALPYPVRAGFSPGIGETFGIWMGCLLGDPLYLAEIGVSPDVAEQLAALDREQKATAAAMSCADGLCTLDYWTEGPLTREQLAERWHTYRQQFMGLDFPRGYLPTIVHTLDLNNVGWPIALARVGHLLDQLERARRDWWHSPAAVDIVRRYMRGGMDAGFPAAMHDVGPFVRRYGME